MAQRTRKARFVDSAESAQENKRDGDPPRGIASEKEEQMKLVKAEVPSRLLEGA